MTSASPSSVGVLAGLDRSIHQIRGHRVMLDADLARLYGVSTKAFNQAVKRNPGRFPADFRFQLSAEETAALRSQSVTSKSGRGGRRYRPYAFTQEGVAMLSGVLSSPRAIAVNVEIMRAFVRLRALVSTNGDILRRLGLLEAEFAAETKRSGKHRVSTALALREVFAALRRLAERAAEPESGEPIGFRTR